MSSIQALVGKAVTDVEFAKKLVANPEATLKANGVDATPEMIAALSAIDADAVQKLASAFTKEKAAY